MKNILVVANNDFALFNYRKELIDALIKRGNVHLILQNKPTFDLRPVQLHIRKSAKNKTLDIFLLFFAILSFLIKHKVSYVYSFTILPGLIVGFLRRFMTFKHVHTITGLGRAFNKNKDAKILVSLIINICFKKTDTFIFQSEEDKSAYEKVIKRRSIDGKVVNGSGVNLDKYTQNIGEKPSALRTRICFVGRIRQDKGIEKIFKLVQLLGSKDLSASFFVYGKIDLPKRTKKLFFKYVQTSSLVYCGFEKNIETILPSFDFIFYYSDYNEGIPRAILEAMACGVVPIINERIFRVAPHLFVNAIVVNEENYLNEVQAAISMRDADLLTLKGQMRSTAEEFLCVYKINETYVQLING